MHFFFSFLKSTEVDFFVEDLKSTLPVFMAYFGVEYAFCFLFTTTVEDICMDREADERIVVDLIVEFGRGCVSHLILNFPSLSPTKIL